MWPPRCRDGAVDRGGYSSAEQPRGRAVFAQAVRCGIKVSAPRGSETLWRLMSQRREIRAWIRNREVGAAYPRYCQVSEAMTPWNPLFFCFFRNQVSFSGNV